MKPMPENVLRELAKAYGRKVKVGETFDANVCAWRIEPGRPWELIPVSGGPFTAQVRFVHHNQRTLAMANEEYLAFFVDLDLRIDALSVNRPEKGDRRYVSSGNILIEKKRYPIFSLSSRLSQEQEALVNSGQFRRLIGQLDLHDEESFHVSQGGLSTYLRYRPVESLLRSLDFSVELLQVLVAELPSDGEYRGLPLTFRPLIPLIRKWAIGDDDLREGLMDEADLSELKDLVAASEPYMNKIDKYLDAFGDQPLHSDAIALSHFAEAAAEAKRRLEAE